MTLALDFIAGLPALHIARTDRQAICHNLARLIAHVRHQDVDLEISHDIDAAAAAFRASNHPVASLLDSRYHLAASTPDQTLVVHARRAGRSIGVSAQRRMWIHGNLGDRMRDLTFWYGARAPDGMVCVANAPCLARINSCYVVYSCGFHCEEAKLSTAIIRMAHASAMLAWEFNWMFGRTTKAMGRRHINLGYGGRRQESGVWLLPRGATADDNYPSTLIVDSQVWMQAVFARPIFGDPAASLGVPDGLRDHGENAA